MKARFFLLPSFAVSIAVAAAALAHPETPEMPAAATASPATGGKPESRPEPARYGKGNIEGERLDEAMAGHTLRGTPVTPRTSECFPAEPRDLFWQMDQVASGGENDPKPGSGRKLEPLNFDLNGNGIIDNDERDGIRGRNTWLLWGGGNEAFWGWLQEEGYGINDFLIVMDSRKRNSRFDDAGLINQPGFRSVTDPSERILGLYLDLPADKNDPKSAYLRPPAYDDRNAETKDAQQRDVQPSVLPPSPPSGHPTQLFKPGDENLYLKVLSQIPKDGLDPTIYGYPSGVFGLRLMLNPDFFGATTEAEEARNYWDERVVKPAHSNYYTDIAVHADPKLIRPFRVSMSCGFCHVGPHPLNPPLDVNHPKWENLSSFIGDQFWKPQAAFGNLLTRGNFLHHFLRSQAPGTVDTSLVSTDHINNANTINAVFDVPARLNRALNNATETQSNANLLIPSIEDGAGVNPRHFPRVLLDGSDSCGAFAAFIRVPLNIGTFSEQWATCHNPVIGFKHQRPFSVNVSQRNSVYWQVNEKYRVPYLKAFFTLKHGPSSVPPKAPPPNADGPVPPTPPPAKYAAQNSTAPMKLKDARDPGPDGKGSIPSAAAREAFAKNTPAQRVHGREVWLKHCAICHSSKQPAGFDISFSRGAPGASWDFCPAPKPEAPAHYTLPMDFMDWGNFKKSPAYKDYVSRLMMLVGAEEGVTAARAALEPPGGPAPVTLADDPLERDHPFWVDNFLSSEVRIPVTLTGTNSARSMATNAMRGQVWDNFSSEDYKNLPSVGKIRYFNVFLDQPADEFGNNDYYSDGRESGGPGYYRPATHISLWAQAPFLHNNTLGLFNGDPSVAGRLASFDDAIRKMLWNRLRKNNTPNPKGGFFVADGDLRSENSRAAARDPGYIYRVPVDTTIGFQPGFIRPLIEGIVGKTIAAILSIWLWVALAIVFLLAVFLGRPRHAGVLLVVTAVVAAAVLLLTGLGRSGGITAAALLMGMGSLLELSGWTWWLIVALLLIAGTVLLLGRQPWLHKAARVLFIVLVVGSIVGGFFVNRFINGKSGPISVGPLPRGTPVSLMMNLDPEKQDEAAGALVGMFRALARIKKDELSGEKAYAVFAQEAGPALIAASKCPDYVLDRGHWFGEFLEDSEKEDLIAFLKTL